MYKKFNSTFACLPAKFVPEMIYIRMDVNAKHRATQHRSCPLQTLSYMFRDELNSIIYYLYNHSRIHYRSYILSNKEFFV